MMMTALFLASALGGAGDPIDARFVPFLKDGCVDGPPIAALQSDEGKPASEIPELIDMPMSHGSLRFVISPDSYRGDGLLMVQIDSGLRRSLASNGKPFFLATVGNWRRTCTVRMPLEDCPKAGEFAEQLKALTIPIGYGLGPLDRIALHATGYTLQFAGDGVNQLSYGMPGNPLESPLERAKEALRSCWEPALNGAKADRAD